MDYLACPSCGSEYFYVMSAGEKVVFKVRQDYTIEIINPPGEFDVDQQHIRCGACSWQGSTNQLVESRS